MLETRGREAKRVDQLIAQITAIVKAATNWKKGGSSAIGTVSGGSVFLEKKGKTIQVIVKDSQGCEIKRGMFGTETFFGKKYKDIVGC